MSVALCFAYCLTDQRCKGVCSRKRVISGEAMPVRVTNATSHLFFLRTTCTGLLTRIYVKWRNCISNASGEGATKGRAEGG